MPIGLYARVTRISTRTGKREPSGVLISPTLRDGLSVCCDDGEYGGNIAGADLAFLAEMIDLLAPCRGCGSPLRSCGHALCKCCPDCKHEGTSHHGH